MNKNELIRTVESARDGSKKAFEVLYNEYYDKLYFFVLKNVGRKDVAEDITQESFLKAMEGISTLEDPANFSTWLHGIAFHKCKDIFRKEKRSAYFDSDEEMDAVMENVSLNEPVMVPEDYATDKERAAELKKMIDELKPDMKSAIILYYYDDMSVADVAKALDMNENAAKQKLFQARKKLKAKIDKMVKDGGVMCCAVPMGDMLKNTVSPKYAASARVSSSAAVTSAAMGTKIAAAATAAVLAVGIPLGLGLMKDKDRGDIRLTDSLTSSVSSSLATDEDSSRPIIELMDESNTDSSLPDSSRTTVDDAVSRADNSSTSSQSNDNNITSDSSTASVSQDNSRTELNETTARTEAEKVVNKLNDAAKFVSYGVNTDSTKDWIYDENGEPQYSQVNDSRFNSIEGVRNYLRGFCTENYINENFKGFFESIGDNDPLFIERNGILYLNQLWTGETNYLYSEREVTVKDMGDDTFSAELITTTATVNGDQRTKEKIHFVIEDGVWKADSGESEVMAEEPVKHDTPVETVMNVEKMLTMTPEGLMDLSGGDYETASMVYDTQGFAVGIRCRSFPEYVFVPRLTDFIEGEPKSKTEVAIPTMPGTKASLTGDIQLLNLYEGAKVSDDITVGMTYTELKNKFGDDFKINYINTSLELGCSAVIDGRNWDFGFELNEEQKTEVRRRLEDARSSDERYEPVDISDLDPKSFVACYITR